MPSLSARRAWIEMLLHPMLQYGNAVALRKESVDRNLADNNLVYVFIGRSPQGERG